MGIVGAGIMGQGIAQVAAGGGIDVMLFDTRREALEKAMTTLGGRFERMREKGQLDADGAAAAKQRIHAAGGLADLAGAEVVVEAIVEDLDAKRAVFGELETLVSGEAILATNTSSLPVASIARDRVNPRRVAGMHFFNPVPLMKLVEVIAGPATAPQTIDRLVELAGQLGRTPVRVKDSPGFLVNLGGRAYPTEGLAVLSESVAGPADIDAVMRDCWGFRMGPFELMDLTGIDINYPVTRFIHEAFGADPRLRTRPQHALLLEAGRLGRKSGTGFYHYEDGRPHPGPVRPPSAAAPPRVVVADGAPLPRELCTRAGVRVLADDDGRSPILAAPVGADCTTLVCEARLDHRRTVAVDPLGDSTTRVTLMTAPGCDRQVLASVVGLCESAGREVTAIADSPGFIGQRVVAMVINLCCEMAQLGLARPEDIDTAMTLGLNYPEGPLAMCDRIGSGVVLNVLVRLQEITGDDRYRPSLWLRRRAQLGLSAREAS